MLFGIIPESRSPSSGFPSTIKNTGASPIKDWTLTWTWPGNQQITQA